MEFMGVQNALIEDTLSMTALRHRVIAGNLANINTPGYRARGVSFDEHLGKAVVKEREDVVVRQDGNTVTLETEAAEMRKNALVHRLFLQAMNKNANMMRSAIRGRSG